MTKHSLLLHGPSDEYWRNHLGLPFRFVYYAYCHPCRNLEPGSVECHADFSKSWRTDNLYGLRHCRHVTIFYGPANGGTTSASWSKITTLGLQAGIFGHTVTGLNSNQTDDLTCQASQFSRDNLGATRSFVYHSGFERAVSCGSGGADLSQ